MNPIFAVVLVFSIGSGTGATNYGFEGDYSDCVESIKNIEADKKFCIPKNEEATFSEKEYFRRIAAETGGIVR